MNGQARKLAELIRDRAPLVQDGQLVVFASGKGGVGKSQLAANLGIELAQRGLRVGLVDLDLSLANLDLVLGVRPELTLDQVVTEETGWRECLVPGPGGVDLLPAGSGLARLASLPPDIRKRLLAALQAYGQERDIVLGDAPSGLSSNVLGFLAASRPPVLVTLPDPTAQADAYGVMKALRGLGSTSPISLIVNRVRTATEGVRVYEKLASMAERFLDAKIRYLGAVPEDRFVAEAGRAREPFRIKRPSSAAARALSYVADQLLVARLTSGDDERSPLLTHR
ncbi:MAG: P-loop NTPase [Planctomycetota bacterium]